MNPPSIQLDRPRRRRKRRTVVSQPTPAALTLVGASYIADIVTLTLTFDRPVDVSAFDGLAVTLDDGLSTGLLYDGRNGATMSGPATVQVALEAIGDPTGVDVRLTATGLTGIVAVDDGGTWGGVTNLELPFP